MKFEFNPITTGIHDLADIVEAAKAYGVKPDKAVAHGIAVHAAIHEQTYKIPAVRILDLTEEQAVDYAFRIARAKATIENGITAVSAAATQIQDQVTRETWEALTADAPRIIKGIRPTFDAAAQRLTEAIELGIEPRSTPQDVLNLESERAATVWNDLPNQVRTLERIKTLRVKLSTKLGLPPQNPYDTEPVYDYTACFAHPDTGLKAGAIIVRPANSSARLENRTPLLEWLTLAAQTGGNMQLN